jgi:hypothetical protein
VIRLRLRIASKLYGWVERALVRQQYAELHRIMRFCGGGTTQRPLRLSCRRYELVEVERAYGFTRRLDA